MIKFYYTAWMACKTGPLYLVQAGKSSEGRGLEKKLKMLITTAQILILCLQVINFLQHQERDIFWKSSFLYEKNRIIMQIQTLVNLNTVTVIFTTGNSNSFGNTNWFFKLTDWKSNQLSANYHNINRTNGYELSCCISCVVETACYTGNALQTVCSLIYILQFSWVIKRLH